MGKRRVKIGADCPNCMAVWGVEEMEWNKCHSCGYPENTESEEEDFDGEADEDYHSEDFDNPPIQQRN